MAKERVLVGLSGGVDSAVAAALLVREGYEVAGLFLKIEGPEGFPCTWKEDRLSAKRVAAFLGIPFFERDLSREYAAEVSTALIEGYRRGETPNPDLLCNKHIKFPFLTAAARELGVDHIATGHYARISTEHGAPELLRGNDSAKDQSYFLARLTRAELRGVLFPVGGLTKSDVRAKARKLGLPNAARRDSQGLCFLGGGLDLKTYLSMHIPVEPGPVCSLSGEIIGEHRGASLYTIGERHGISYHHAPAKPHYIVRIDVSENTLTVSPDPQKAARTHIPLRDLSWISEHPLPSGVPVEYQVRYHQTPGTGMFEERNGTAILVTSRPEVVAEGQSVVLYHAEHCLGVGDVHK